MAEEAPTLGDLETGNSPAPQVVESVAETLRSVMDDDVDDQTDGAATEGGTDEGAGEEAGQPRDEHGRFASTREDGDDSQAAGEEEGKDEGDKPLDPPADWPADMHETFRALDQKAQKFVLDQVQDASAKIGEATQATERYRTFDALLGEFKGHWAAKGLDEVQAIRSIGTLSEFADQNPAEFIKWFAQGKNIDLRTLAGADPAAAVETDDDDEWADPEVKALKSALAETRRELDAIKGTVESRAREETERTTAQDQQRVIEAVTSFREAKTDDGKLAHPYFDQVADFMVSLIEAEQRRGNNLSLADAYETACRADRDVSAKIESARKAAEAREEAKRRHGKSTAATRAGSSVSGKPAPTETHTSDEIADILTVEAKRHGLIPNAI